MTLGVVIQTLSFRNQQRIYPGWDSNPLGNTEQKSMIYKNYLLVYYLVLKISMSHSIIEASPFKHDKICYALELAVGFVELELSLVSH